jgi:glycosyltransferase involved in cell wall biosynthesis
VSPRFSIVYPTRHRPEFVEQALRILESQRHTDFEVVVSDNYVDPDRSCERVCRASSLPNVRYVRPPEPLGMVGNWNVALPHATGEYVAFLTDKTFVLPDVLARVDAAIRQADEPEIVSWTTDFYFPARYPDYFGEGVYGRSATGIGPAPFRRYEPRRELDRRGRAAVSRSEQGVSDYCRGKLAFGVYHRDLVERIVGRFGTLFHNISPDYTSMVLGLSEARTAIEMGSSGVVSVNSEISNGFLVDTNDRAALEFVESLDGGAREILPRLLVPGLYASLHNLVAHDYLTLREAFGLGFAFDRVNWLAYCHEDIHRPGRTWTDPAVEADQKALLAAHLEALDLAERDAVRHRLAERAADPRRYPLRGLAGRMARRVRRRQPARAPSIGVAIAQAVAAGS